MDIFSYVLSIFSHLIIFFEYNENIRPHRINKYASDKNKLIHTSERNLKQNETEEIKTTGDIDRLIDAKMTLNSLENDLKKVIFQRLGKIVDMSRYPLSFMEREKFLKDLLPIEQQIFWEAKEKVTAWNLVLLNYLSGETTAEAENNGF